MTEPNAGEPLLHRAIEIPADLTTTAQMDGRTVRYGGDVRLGNLRGTGQVDFLAYRSVDVAHDEGGMKPCFLGAFTADGEVLWSVGEGGDQPCRPGPVAVFDVDGDVIEPGQGRILNISVTVQPGAPSGTHNLVLTSVLLSDPDGVTAAAPDAAGNFIVP